MTKYKIWQEVNNTCKGKYFSPEGLDENNWSVFSFVKKDILYELFVNTYWEIEFYGDRYHDSTEHNKNLKTDLLLKHSWDDLIVTEVSLDDNYNLSFLLKGKLMLGYLLNKKVKELIGNQFILSGFLKKEIPLLHNHQM
jgi:hypothetical protein